LSAIVATLALRPHARARIDDDHQQKGEAVAAKA
jgi:hypothetical protein